MASETDHDDKPNGPGLPSVKMPTIDKRWVSQDLQILKSGLFADAEIICEGDATPRKVHRNVLTARSAWFMKAFTGDYKEAKEGKVTLQETPWSVDLMLYFFYTGGIDLEDKALTSGHDVMDISIELLRLGDFFQSTEMHQHGKSMLAEYVRDFLSRMCTSSFTGLPAENDITFKAETDFSKRFCRAVANAFDKDRPVKLAQDILADLAFAARIHLFKDKRFMTFIRRQIVPQFGNRVLAAQIDGTASDVFNGDSTFEHWKNWKVTPTMGSSSQRQGLSAFGTAFPGVANVAGTAPPVASGLSTATPLVANVSGTAPPPVSNGLGTAAPQVTSGFSGFGIAPLNAPGSSFGGAFGSTGNHTGVGSAGQTGGTGFTYTHAGAGSVGHNIPTEPPGTAVLAFSPHIQHEPNSTEISSYQSILFSEPYNVFSTEELRMADYSQGRQNADGSAGVSGAPGTSFSFGGGGFINITTHTTAFRRTNT